MSEGWWRTVTRPVTEFRGGTVLVSASSRAISPQKKVARLLLLLEPRSLRLPPRFSVLIDSLVHTYDFSP